MAQAVADGLTFVVTTVIYVLVMKTMRQEETEYLQKKEIQR